MFPKDLPYAELLSERAAALRKSRLLMPTRSSANLPTVALCDVCSDTAGITPPAKDPVPAVRPWTLAVTPWREERKYWTPAEVTEFTFGASRKDPEAQTLPVQL